MNIQDPQEIRRAFGQAIIDYRHGSRRKISQGELCAAICSNLNKEMAKQLYQEKLSKIERGYKQPVLPERIIVAISDYCNIPADIRDAYLNLNYKLSRTEEVAKVCVTGHGQLITSKERSEFKIYLGEYNCYFVSTESQKDKVEFLCNECCRFGCKDRKRCYEDVSRKNLGEDGLEHRCTAPHADEGYRFSKAMTNPGFISIEDIQNIYLPMGFTNFKIEGRGLGSALVLEFLLYYMTKPEYQIHVREEMYLDNMLDLF